jgi:hypothetical protein
MSDTIYLYQSVSLSPVLQQYLSLAHTHSQHCHPLHYHSTTYIIRLIHCIRYTALLKTLHIHLWWDVLPCCCDPQWLNTTFVFPGLQTNLNPWRSTIFFTDGVCGGKNLNICVLDHRHDIKMSCLWSDQSDFMALFIGFNLKLVWVLFLRLVVKF